MRKMIITFMLVSGVAFGQTDTTIVQADTVVDTAAQADYYEHPEKEHKHKKGCYCPYQKSSTVWHDVVNDGIVGTGKAVYQSTVKPQVIGEAVGYVQGVANDSPLPSLAASTILAFGTSQIHKSRRNKKNKQVPKVGQECNCDPCAYHAQRYKPAQGTN